jgi:predicted adenine nucleotide alpha hydrolase (AANH) superfamily ATPase
LEYLAPKYDITCFFYNPNISDFQEYQKRLDELFRYNKEGGFGVRIIDGGYEVGAFEKAVKGLENEPERGRRCEVCFRMRLAKTAEFFKDFTGFSTELQKNGGNLGENSLELSKNGEKLTEKPFNWAENSEETPTEIAGFTTTLTISPHKSAPKINEIGGEFSGYLPSDFKKKGGYQRSIVLSREYNLYRQSYCGCRYSQERSNSLNAPENTINN